MEAPGHGLLTKWGTRSEETVYESEVKQHYICDTVLTWRTSKTLYKIALIAAKKKY